MRNQQYESCSGIGDFGLGLFPLFMRDFGDLMFEEEDAFLIADNNVGIFFVRDVSSDNLGADTGVAVDEVRDEVSLALGRANEFEPIENGGIIGFGISAVRAVSPKAFAGDDVFETVAVHVD